jgi:hypothetical protein
MGFERWFTPQAYPSSLIHVPNNHYIHIDGSIGVTQSHPSDCLLPMEVKSKRRVTNFK